MAKLAEDNWVTAMAWRHQASAATANSVVSDPVSYGSRDDISAVEEAPSVSRWRSARATARQARRINASSGGGGGGVTAVAASTALRNPSSPHLNLGEINTSGAARAGGGDANDGWHQAVAAVIVGGDSESSGEETSR